MNQSTHPPYELNKIEEKIFLKNGFYVKNICVDILDFLFISAYRTFFWCIALPFILLGLILFLEQLGILSMTLFPIFELGTTLFGSYGIYLLGLSIYYSYFLRYVYFSRGENNVNTIIIGNTQDTGVAGKKLEFLFGKDISWFMRPSRKYGDSAKFYVSIIVIFGLSLGLYLLWNMSPWIILGIMGFLGTVFFFSKNHPLYTFGNLGEKIQKLTPMIGSKSKEIQENFEKDMNFRVLSEGFDSLSSTFSEIVRLVIRLEQVEKRANKGNLFDSEKYINSLRGDILTPLQSLKSFLESQREKLRKSQKELQKVRVRVGDNGDSASSGEGRNIELRSETELSSKRGASLLIELDENIGKLDEMISRMS